MGRGMWPNDKWGCYFGLDMIGILAHTQPHSRSWMSSERVRYWGLWGAHWFGRCRVGACTRRRGGGGGAEVWSFYIRMEAHMGH